MANVLIGNAPCSWGTLEFEGFGENQVTAGQMLDEQDLLPGMGTPKQSALRNRQYLRALGL